MPESAGSGVGLLAPYRQLTATGDKASRELLPYFGMVGSPEVYSLVYHKGLPLILERLRKVNSMPPDESEFDREEFLLPRILVGFAYPKAFPEVLRLARDPQLHDSYWWGSIFSAADEGDKDFHTLELIDYREIFWPPLGERRPVTLLRWTLRDDSGVGMTGGMTTWCFFSRQDNENPPWITTQGTSTGRCRPMNSKVPPKTSIISSSAATSFGRRTRKKAGIRSRHPIRSHHRTLARACLGTAPS